MRAKECWTAGKWRTGAVHTGQRRILAPGAVDRVVRDQAILRIAKYRVSGFFRKEYQAAGLLYRCVCASGLALRHFVDGLRTYAVDFNEDFSALHGPTLKSQISYSARAIDYILLQYAAGTKIIVMGHSMEDATMQ